LKKIWLWTLLSTCAAVNAAAPDGGDLNCFTILVGRNATVDGSVLVAHNEDNAGPPFVELHKVPRLRHAPGEKQVFFAAAISPVYEKTTVAKALRNYSLKDRDYRSMTPGHACWVFGDFAAEVDSVYGRRIKSLKKWKTEFETDVLTAVKTGEPGILDVYRSDPDRARRMLTALTTRYAEKALMETRERSKK
jgi:dipeptidase